MFSSPVTTSSNVLFRENSKTTKTIVPSDSYEPNYSIIQFSVLPLHEHQVRSKMTTDPITKKEVGM